MSNTLEFEWVSRNGQFQTGNGVVRAPEGVVNFVVKKPHELRSSHPVLVAPGFTDGTTGPGRLTNYFTEEGRLAVTLSHPRTDHPYYKGDPEGHKADNLRITLEATHDIFPEMEEDDLVGHSEGGANASRLALEFSGQTRSLTVVASGGLIEGDSVTRIFRRASGNLKNVIQLAGHLASHLPHDLRLLGSSVSYVAKNPRKAIEEAAHIASTDIRHRFQSLREAGVPTAALQFGGDALFPLHLVEDSTSNGEIFDHYSVYPHDRMAGHLTPQFHPRRVGRIVLDGIDSMTAS